jgi:DNA-binding transcriptional ArsR family regulator
MMVKRRAISERIIRSGKEDLTQINNLAQFFSVLADTTRLRIVQTLLLDELCVHEIASRLKISLSAVSHQLRFLRTMRLVFTLSMMIILNVS